MSKVQALKIWMCVGLLFAFLSGASVVLFVNPMEAPIADIQSPQQFLEDFSREMDLDEEQKRELVVLLDAWEEKRNEIRARYQPEVNDLNVEYQGKIEALLTPAQLEIYNQSGGDDG